MEVIGVDAHAPSPEALDRAIRAVRAGGLLIFPTDTLYAVGGPAADPEAARQVRAAKGREDGKPLPVVAADLAQVRTLTANWSALADRLAARFWPGPLTLVVEAAPGLAESLTAGTKSIAVRVPALELTRQLCRRLGPLISTSANRSGEAAPETCAAAVGAFPGLSGLALDAGRGTPDPSTIVDVTGAEAVLLRKGSIDWSKVKAVLDAGQS